MLTMSDSFLPSIFDSVPNISSSKHISCSVSNSRFVILAVGDYSFGLIGCCLYCKSDYEELSFAHSPSKLYSVI
jgi:hypothetical protein